MKEREKLKCGVGFYLMADRAILPTEAITENRLRVDIEPVTVFDYRNRAEFIAALEKAIAAGNPVVPNPTDEELQTCGDGFSEFKEPAGLKYSGLPTWDELERKSILASIRCYPSGYLLEVFDRANDGKWSEDTALELRLPANVGLSGVVDAILDHLKSRKDIPGSVVDFNQSKTVKGA
ncbi:MAG: hypothetical protein LCH63_16990 [Candidatus Melainabacteria bacterium]|nr:hypothetical protein [Candidatus Melainabacteria bacterium]